MIRTAERTVHTADGRLKGQRRRHDAKKKGAISAEINVRQGGIYNNFHIPRSE